MQGKVKKMSCQVQHKCRVGPSTLIVPANLDSNLLTKVVFCDVDIKHVRTSFSLPIVPTIELSLWSHVQILTL